MTTLATTITSTAQTTFSSVPNGITQATSNSTGRFATTAYIQANASAVNSALYLNTNTAQTLTGTTGLSFILQQSVTDIDAINVGDTLVVGETADANIALGQATSACQLFIKTYLQPISSIWKYWGNGSINLIPAGTGVSLTSVAVLCTKIQSGSFVISTTSTYVPFLTSYTSKPAVFLTIRSTSTAVGLNNNKWVSGFTTSGSNYIGFTVNSNITGATFEMNWFAIGS